MSDTKLLEGASLKMLVAAIYVSAGVLLATFALPAAVQGQARPDISVVAGARTLPEVSFLRHAKSRCDRYVSTGGDDDNSGRTVKVAWRTIGMALRTLRAGEVGCVLSGIYEEGHNEAQNHGTPKAPIVLKRAPGSAMRPIIKPRGAVPVFHIDRDFWLIDGFDIDVNFQKVTGFRFWDNADHCILRNSRVHNSTSGASVYISGRDILVEACEIFNNFKTDEQDSHGVAIVPPSARVWVKRNRIWDNGGDGIQCEDYANVPRNPEDITLEDNLIFTTPSNLGRTENAVDIKSCKYVTIRGSKPIKANDKAAPNRFYGFALKSTSKGEGIVVHYNAKHILIENTMVGDVCRGLSVGRGEDPSTLVENMVIHGNLIHDLKQGSGCDGNGILISRASHLDVYRNTLRNIPRAGFRIGVNNSTGSPDIDVDFWENTIGPAARWLDIAAEPAKLDSFVSDRNRFLNVVGTQEKFFVGGKTLSIGEWRRLSGTRSILTADPRSIIVPKRSE
jgi:hypothetical protein